MHVLTLSTLFPDTSRPNFGIFVERQTRELARQPGVTVTVIAAIGLPPFPFSRLAPYRAIAALPVEDARNDLTIHRPRFPIIPKIGARFHVASMTRALMPLVRRLHAQAPFDVIDASFFFPDGAVARNLSQALGIAYSVKARGADIHHWGSQRATRAAVIAAGRDAAGLLAVSGAMRQSMIDLGMDGDRITVHHTGVDLDRFDIADRVAAKTALGVSGPMILSTGALIPRKGQSLLINALTALPGVTLCLAGEGPDRQRLVAQAARLGLTDRVRLLGSVPNADLPRWLNAADVMALPSASEGLANAWVEALACGTPVVISDVGGGRDVVKTHAAGHIVMRESSAIAAAIAALVNAPPDRNETRRAALGFTWEANAVALAAHLRACAGLPSA